MNSDQDITVSDDGRGNVLQAQDVWSSIHSPDDGFHLGADCAVYTMPQRSLSALY
jgi:hypothetical protein